MSWAEPRPNPSIERHAPAGFSHLRMPLMSNVRRHGGRPPALCRHAMWQHREPTAYNRWNLRMPRPRPAYIVYLVGVAIVGLFYAWAKATVESEPVFFLLALAYLIVLRLVAEGVERHLRQRNQRQSKENGD